MRICGAESILMLYVMCMEKTMQHLAALLTDDMTSFWSNLCADVSLSLFRIVFELSRLPLCNIKTYMLH